MKSSYAALAVVGLALTGLWYVGGGTAVPARAEQPRVSAPLGYDNLTVYFIHGPDAFGDTHKVATLQEALDAGWAVVHETGDVNTLSVENRSADTELFIQEGDIIKGGRQDRMIAGDMLLPPKSGVVPFPAHCVEQGRWTGRGGEAATHFNKSDQFAVGNDIRYANATYDQSKVWENVKAQQTKLSDNLGVKVNSPASETSLQLALENRAVQDRVAEFEQALRATGETRKNVIGVVFVVNGRVTGAELYGSNALFVKAWPKLLRSSAASAVAEKTDKPTMPAPAVAEVERLLACAGQQPATPTDHPANIGGIDNVRGAASNLAVYSRQSVGVGRALSIPNPSSAAPDNVNPAELFERLSRAGVRTELYSPHTSTNQTVNPIAATPDNIALGGAIGGRPDEQQLRQLAQAWSNPPREPRRGDVEEQINRLPERYRAMVREYFQQLERGQQPLPQPAPPEFAGRGNQAPAGFVPARGALNPAPAVVNPQGNRLNVKRVEDSAGLVTESRDPARQNAVIHRSLIKK